MLKTAVGHSNDLSPAKAIEVIIRSCKEQMGEHKPQAGFFFTSILDIDYHPILTSIRNAFPDIHLIGCTTDGESCSGNPFSYDSMVLMLIASDKLTFASGLGQELSKDPKTALAKAHTQAQEKLGHRPAMTIVLPDGLKVIDMHLDTHLRNQFGENHPIFGAKAGDRFRLQRTFQFHGGQVFSDAISLMHIAGPLAWSSKVLSGLNPVGDRYKATCTGANVLTHIGDMPALDYYKHFIGDSMEVINQFPLAVFDVKSDSFFLRPPCFIDEPNKAIIFNGTFPDTFEVQLTEMGPDSLLEAAHMANKQALEEYPGTYPQLGFQFSCCSRRAHLGTRTPDESQELLGMDHERFRYAGFYSYGEIAPLEKGGPVRIHNETYVIVMLGES